MNLFDGIQNRMFDTVAKTFGYIASWSPSTGGQAITGEVLLKEPTEQYDLNGVPVTPFHRILEWREGKLPGLFEAIRAKQSEIVVVNGRSYFCRSVDADYDGRTYRAEIEFIRS